MDYNADSCRQCVTMSTANTAFRRCCVFQITSGIHRNIAVATATALFACSAPSSSHLGSSRSLIGSMKTSLWLELRSLFAHQPFQEVDFCAIWLLGMTLGSTATSNRIHKNIVATVIIRLSTHLSDPRKHRSRTFKATYRIHENIAVAITSCAHQPLQGISFGAMWLLGITLGSTATSTFARHGRLWREFAPWRHPRLHCNIDMGEASDPLQ